MWAVFAQILNSAPVFLPGSVSVHVWQRILNFATREDIWKCKKTMFFTGSRQDSLFLSFWKKCVYSDHYLWLTYFLSLLTSTLEQGEAQTQVKVLNIKEVSKTYLEESLLAFIFEELSSLWLREMINQFTQMFKKAEICSVHGNTLKSKRGKKQLNPNQQ